jgi:Fe-S-cluster-containing dehydrogenase component
MPSSRRTFLKAAGTAVVLAGGCVPLLAAMTRARAATPTSAGGPPKRWAMVVDVRQCLGQEKCGACSEACHRRHNVPRIADVPGHEIKWIWKEQYEHAFPDEGHAGGEHGGATLAFAPAWLHEQPLPVLCNHCERPPCVRVCPTQATFKRESDGIVMMDEHRCIGCRYCMAACPYGARSFNFVDPRPYLEAEGRLHDGFPSRTKGVVEKCNFCADLLIKGEPPACVAACRARGAGALIFGDLYDPGSEVVKIIRASYTTRRKLSLGTEPHVFYLV